MKIDISNGDKFGNLTVIKEVNAYRQPSGQTQRAILCQCDCGNQKTVRLSQLIRLRIISCGCKQKVRNGESTSRIYKTWKSMKERVHLKSYIRSNRYSERGISICKEWDDDYFAFKNWALNNGYADNLQIDRIDNNGNYEPSNCRFVTNLQNANNREITFFVNYKNEKYPIMELFRKLNIPESNRPTIRARILRGWDHTEAFDKPIRNGNYKKRITA
jgi:hypothetical protein